MTAIKKRERKKTLKMSTPVDQDGFQTVMGKGQRKKMKPMKLVDNNESVTSLQRNSRLKRSKSTSHAKKKQPQQKEHQRRPRMNLRQNIEGRKRNSNVRHIRKNVSTSTSEVRNNITEEIISTITEDVTNSIQLSNPEATNANAGNNMSNHTDKRCDLSTFKRKKRKSNRQGQQWTIWQDKIYNFLQTTANAVDNLEFNKGIQEIISCTPPNGIISIQTNQTSINLNTRDAAYFKAQDDLILQETNAESRKAVATRFARNNKSLGLRVPTSSLTNLYVNDTGSAVIEIQEENHLEPTPL